MSTLFQTLPDAMPLPGFDESAQQSPLNFGVSLCEAYKPRTIDSFIGLAKVKKILTRIAEQPRECALLFIGEPGCGKSSMAAAFAAKLGAELHTLGSAECKLEALQTLVRTNQFIPLSGGWHVNVVEEADVMSDTAQKYLLSRLDGTATCPKTIWIFTANNTDGLENRFQSRCLRVDFGSYGSGGETAALLRKIWDERAPEGAEAPDFKRMACSNIRESLQRLDVVLLSA